MMYLYTIPQTCTRMECINKRRANKMCDDWKCTHAIRNQPRSNARATIVVAKTDVIFIELKRRSVWVRSGYKSGELSICQHRNQRRWICQILPQIFLITAHFETASLRSHFCPINVILHLAFAVGCLLFDSLVARFRRFILICPFLLLSSFEFIARFWKTLADEKKVKRRNLQAKYIDSTPLSWWLRRLMRYWFAVWLIGVHLESLYWFHWYYMHIYFLFV